MKYIAIINPCLKELEALDRCSYVYNVPSSIVGEADDVTVSAISKIKMDRILGITYKSSCTWRYANHARKSAFIVYGENKRHDHMNITDRCYKFGNSVFSKEDTYDPMHVGVKACLFCGFSLCLKERLTKGQSVIHAVTGFGIKKIGLTMSRCNVIVWSITVPIISFRCKMWIPSRADLEMLEAFQCYVESRMQRFPSRSLNHGSYANTG